MVVYTVLTHFLTHQISSSHDLHIHEKVNSSKFFKIPPSTEVIKVEWHEGAVNDNGFFSE